MTILLLLVGAMYDPSLAVRVGEEAPDESVVAFCGGCC